MKLVIGVIQVICIINLYWIIFKWNWLLKFKGQNINRTYGWIERRWGEKGVRLTMIVNILSGTILMIGILITR